MHADDIIITRARENNLKDVSLRIPKGRLVVVTGVSGSGKSSLAFGTVAVEARRQLAETFGWFARDRMPKHERPDADAIENLAPAVVVDQRPIGGGARSTVGTASEINPVLRVLFSRHGAPSAGEASAYSFNDPRGMCPECEGLGRVTRVDLDRFLDTGKTLNEGAVNFPPFGVGTFVWQLYAESGLFDPDKPLRDFTAEEWDLLLHGKGFRVKRLNRTGSVGTNAYEGLVERFDRLYVKRDLDSLKGNVREAARRVVREQDCPECGGSRLNAAARASTIAGRSLPELCAMEVGDLAAVLEEITGPVAGPVAASVAGAAAARLRRLEEIGLGYLSLDRETRTLSGGEAQRLKVVRHLGSSLTGMTYVFDEPSAGLHPSDVDRLVALLRRLRDKGNTVLVVEHDPAIVSAADHVVDMGPGAGARGGEVVFAGTVAALRDAGTATGRALRRVTPVKAAVREPSGWLAVTGANARNLADVTVRFPAGVLTAVTGVAGSGKSSLVMEEFAARHEHAIVVDQSAITASRRSSPATFLGAMDPLRRLFARANGVDAALFSHNSAGACPGCDGAGVIRTDLAFMDPVTVRCEACGGRRYRPEVLALTLRGRSIADVLETPAEQAVAFFTGDDAAERAIAGRLRALVDVGLGHMAPGRPLSSLSGGERQRVKLAARLHRTGQLYVLDEPTAGLHTDDVAALLALLDRLVDAGNTVIVVEHDLAVVKHADWVIDLGPGGGRAGGRVMFEGTPAGLVNAEGSVTAEFLRRSLGAPPGRAVAS
ncbi:ATP-binding cassette domain-containing protein [Actinomadura violacea]|uniref:UvrABC system protein A n=1 Tax=Actinomadura violacea TaxID=2819934 RepID=A0ABS3RJV2_9ACTN|nr:excinuclease ABC subunit UvrA [Actinomadura violacea]MBO2457020.1 excinuclease ABC subunit UvrA [Actinomadura violacea]